MTGTSLFGITFITFSRKKEVSILGMPPTVHCLWTSPVQSPAQWTCLSSLWWKHPWRLLCWDISSCSARNKDDFSESNQATHQMKFRDEVFAFLFWRSNQFISIYFYKKRILFTTDTFIPIVIIFKCSWVFYMFIIYAAGWISQSGDRRICNCESNKNTMSRQLWDCSVGKWVMRPNLGSILRNYMEIQMW